MGNYIILSSSVMAILLNFFVMIKSFGRDSFLVWILKIISIVILNTIFFFVILGLFNIKI